MSALLFEIDHANGTEFLCDTPLPAVGLPVPRDNQWRTYFALVLESSHVNARIDSVIQLGDITVINDGSLDNWWNYDFTNKEVRCYIGDEAETRDKYTLAFTAKNGGISSSELGLISIDLIDSKYSINDADIFPDKNAPVSFGSIYNAPCELLDVATRFYRVSQLGSSPIDAKDKGNKALTESGNSSGFNLTVTPAGVITADTISPSDTPQQIITELCLLAGVTVNTDSLALLPSYSMGVYYSSPPALSTILNDIVIESLGGLWRRNESGEIQVFLKTLANGEPTLAISDHSISEFSIVTRSPEYGSVVLNYGINFRPMSQAELADPSVLGTDYVELQQPKRQITEPTGSDSVEVFEVNTFINNSSDALTEAKRLALIKAISHQTWRLVIVGIGASLLVGDIILITSQQYGPVFSEGVLVRIVGISKSLTNDEIELEVWF